jgi:hypothetical protein
MMIRTDALHKSRRRCLIHALPTEIRSKVRILGERGHEGGGEKAMQKERGSGAGERCE